MAAKQIRFWHYHNGSSVLIKIRAGQTLSHENRGPTDEGWFHEANEWTFDGETLISEWSSDGADCDGRLSRHGASYCSADNLRAGYHDPDEGITFPAWENGEHRQRDYSAEAMGY